jgi:hypothetical protein
LTDARASTILAGDVVEAPTSSQSTASATSSVMGALRPSRINAPPLVCDEMGGSN